MRQIIITGIIPGMYIHLISLVVIFIGAGMVIKYRKYLENEASFQ